MGMNVRVENAALLHRFCEDFFGGYSAFVPASKIELIRGLPDGVFVIHTPPLNAGPGIKEVRMGMEDGNLVLDLLVFTRARKITDTHVKDANNRLGLDLDRRGDVDASATKKVFDALHTARSAHTARIIRKVPF